MLQSALKSDDYKVSELKYLFEDRLVPIHSEAQKYVKPPDNLNLQEKLDLNAEEVEMVNSMAKTFDLEEKKKKSKVKTKKLNIKKNILL